MLKQPVQCDDDAQWGTATGGCTGPLARLILVLALHGFPRPLPDIRIGCWV